MISARHWSVLQQIYATLKDKPINWVVTGSLGMALQGVDVPVNDIDLQTDAEGAYAVESLLAEYRVKPVVFSAAERIRSHYGGLEIDGMQVEIIGAVEKKLPDGTWESPVNPADHRVFVEQKDMRIPVLPLEYEYQAYLKLGRVERAEHLRNWLDREG